MAVCADNYSHYLPTVIEMNAKYIIVASLNYI